MTPISRLRFTIDKSTSNFYNKATISDGPIAQWLEQPAHNRQVLGSNPSGPTTFPFVCLSRLPYGALAQGYERYLHTVEVTGSNPVRPTTHLTIFPPVSLKFRQAICTSSVMKNVTLIPNVSDFTRRVSRTPTTFRQKCILNVHGNMPVFNISFPLPIR